MTIIPPRKKFSNTNTTDTDTDRASMRRHHIFTELLKFSIIENEIYYDRKSSPLPSRKSPEQHAKELAEDDPFWIMQTTSWRYQNDSTGVFLTWATLLKNPNIKGMRQLQEPHVVFAPTHHQETAEDTDYDISAWNAIRHYSFMLNYDAAFARDAAIRGIAQSLRFAGQKLVAYQNTHSL